MFTWISEISQARARIARASALAVILPLAGCFGPDTGTLSFLASGNEGKQDVVARDVLRKVELYDGDVVVRATAGYCIDRKTLRRSKSEGFILMASCEALSGVRGHDVEPVLMTISVLPDQPGVAKPTAQEIAASVAPAGVLGSVERDDLTLVHFASGGDGVLAEGDARHWRGGMVLNGHLIGLALYARKNSPMAGKEGRGLLTELARSMRRSSPKRAAPATGTPAAETTAPPPRGLGDLLGGLFPDSG